jgi:3'(2'), 5'-bisphosphate nucleotidase
MISHDIICPQFFLNLLSLSPFKMPTSSYDKELETALRAVHLASLASKHLLHSKDKGSRLKADYSPVTIADYASQALLIATVRHDFPNDSFLGEESAAELRKNTELCDRVWYLILVALHQNDSTGLILGDEMKDKDDMLRCIDLGGEGMGGREEKRVWMLDPLDGTAAFMSGGQYAICLALVEGGDQKLGVIGCPNLPFDAAHVNESIADVESYGCLLNAVKNHGSFVREMKANQLGLPRNLTHNNVEVIHIVQPSNSSYDFEKQQKVAEKLGAAWPGTKLWSSQMRFVALALGEGSVQIAFRKPRDYHSCVWDVAGGALIFEEAGGTVTDADGNPLDFQQGRRLEKNWGIVAARSSIHARVLATAKQVYRELDSDSI